ncbi:hypothetical protein [Flavobacterium okayamense]|uniref:Uncharacterized protein n=1 Tax=Flavobacterium okayamense TaxID=2830782 RepID=A0ABN6HW51_9FLAO|nr:hypothetical protein [Flavobacterium okayamense]BCY28597.1 hypothetical protein KK2020170_14650 [Flavobacterium okayamense]
MFKLTINSFVVGICKKSYIKLSYRRILLIIFTITFSSSFAQNKEKSKINTKINKDYNSSRKAFKGKLNSEEYKEIRNLILKELKVEIPEKNAILINYYQYGNNCYEYKLDEKDALTVIQNCFRISSRLSKENNTSDFFVYSSEALKKERIETFNNFILDSGFFDKNIFTLKENCRAFFILKSDGEFLKYYGSDYFSEVKNFLEKK